MNIKLDKRLVRVKQLLLDGEDTRIIEREVDLMIFNQLYGKVPNQAKEVKIISSRVNEDTVLLRLAYNVKYDWITYRDFKAKAHEPHETEFGILDELSR